VGFGSDIGYGFPVGFGSRIGYRGSFLVMSEMGIPVGFGSGEKSSPETGNGDEDGEIFPRHEAGLGSYSLQENSPLPCLIVTIFQCFHLIK
jgi:hypothetical protein